MKKGILRSKASLPAWTKATPAPLAVSVEPEFVEVKERPSPLPWRRQLAGWPDEWREVWGRAANALEDTGLDWKAAEKQAFTETLALKRQGTAVAEVAAVATTKTLFREVA